MKKILMILGSVFALIILIIGGLILSFNLDQKEFDKTAKPYIENNIGKITTWDYKKFKALLTSDAQEAFETEDGKKTIKFFSKLGKPVEFSDAELQHIQNSTDTDKDILIYNINGKFENGEALLTITLNYRENSYLIRHININSNAFLNE